MTDGCKRALDGDLCHVNRVQQVSTVVFLMETVDTIKLQILSLSWTRFFEQLNIAWLILIIFVASLTDIYTLYTSSKHNQTLNLGQFQIISTSANFTTIFLLMQSPHYSVHFVLASREPIREVSL